jgi:hypothetical protein
METVEHHIAECGRCAQELESCYRAQALLTTCRDAEVPASQTGWAALRAQIVSEKPVPTIAAAPSERREIWPRAAAPRSFLRLQTVSGFAAILLFGAFCYRMGRMPVAPALPDITKDTKVSHLVGTTPDLPSDSAVVAPMEPDFFDVARHISRIRSSETTPSQLKQVAYNSEPVIRKRVPEFTSLAERDESDNKTTSLTPAKPSKTVIKFEPRRRDQEELPKNTPEKPHYTLGQITPVNTPRHFIMQTLEPTSSDLDTVY